MYGSVDPVEFLNFYLRESPELAQLTPRVVRNVYTGYEGQPYIMSEQDKLKMMMDYRDVLDHPASTLKEVFGPLQAP